MHLVLPLVADNVGLERLATAVSTPGSPTYGRYESIASLSRRFGASAGTRGRAIRFLRRAGGVAVRMDATGLFVSATMPAASAERAFGTSLAEYRTARATRYTAPTSAVRIPRELLGVATGVIGLDTEPLVNRPVLFHTQQAFGSSAYMPATGTAAGCAAALAAGGFTPSQYLDAYGYNTLQAGGTLGQGERVALIEIDGYKNSDLKAFANCFRLHLPQIDQFGVNLSRKLAPGGEATLDLEMLTAAAPDLTSVDVYESGAEAGDVLHALTEPLNSKGFKPQVISASLGLCESQTLAAIGRAGLKTVESALAEATASGISLLSASGDDGSSGCIDPSSAQQLPLPQLSVDYPASSKWVTAIGGTNVQLTPQNTIASQQVWNDQNSFEGPLSTQLGAAGGGFSTLFKRPNYQNGTVAQNQRAVPDLSLLSDIEPGYDVYCTALDCVSSTQTNPWQTVGGTSAATPLLAGGFALIDQVLREHELDNLGLANPLLYRIGRNPAQAPSVFNDVTVGSNDIGEFITEPGAALGCCTAGVGFDEASGWGGLNLGALSAVALESEPKIVNVGLQLNRAQRPYASRGIFARVRCDGACLIGANAVVTVGGAKPFTVYSSLYHMNSAGVTISKIAFKPGQLEALKIALAHRVRVTAEVTGAIVDSGGNVERKTPSQLLKITA